MSDVPAHLYTKNPPAWHYCTRCFATPAAAQPLLAAGAGHPAAHCTCGPSSSRRCRTGPPGAWPPPACRCCAAGRRRRCSRRGRPSPPQSRTWTRPTAVGQNHNKKKGSAGIGTQHASKPMHTTCTGATGVAVVHARQARAGLKVPQLHALTGGWMPSVRRASCALAVARVCALAERTVTTTAATLSTTLCR